MITVSNLMIYRIFLLVIVIIGVTAIVISKFKQNRNEDTLLGSDSNLSTLSNPDNQPKNEFAPFKRNFILNELRLGELVALIIGILIASVITLFLIASINISLYITAIFSYYGVYAIVVIWIGFLSLYATSIYTDKDMFEQNRLGINSFGIWFINAIFLFISICFASLSIDSQPSTPQTSTSKHQPHGGYMDIDVIGRKIDRGEELTPEEAQRIHDIINYEEK